MTPNFPTSAIAGSPDHIRTHIACERCDARNDVHSRVLPGGELQPAPWRAALAGGFRVSRTGRVVCSPTCADALDRYPEESKYTLDASRYPTDPRLRWAAPPTTTRRIPSGPSGVTTLSERTIIVRCAFCNSIQEALQSRVEPSGEWLPDPRGLVEKCGWVFLRGSAYCGLDHARRANPRLTDDPALRPAAVVTAVTTLGARAAAEASYRARRDAGAPTVPTPQPPATTAKPRRSSP